MTIEELGRGLMLFGFNLQVTESHVSFEHKNVLICVKRGVSEDELKLLLLNIPRWVKLTDEAI